MVAYGVCMGCMFALMRPGRIEPEDAKKGANYSLRDGSPPCQSAGSLYVMARTR